MATRSLGVLTLDITAKTGNFEQGMDKAARASDRASKKMAADAKRAAAEARAAFGNIAKYAAGALAGISVGAAFKSIIDNTKQAEQEQAQLAAVLKSTGNAAGYTRDELNKMAGALSGKSIFSTNEINQAQTALLAFTGVVGSEFVRAQQSAADMAARTGMSIQATTELIGRALDVPSQGMASLSRQGFRFSEDQKKLMQQFEATGETAKAQAIILEALEESYGGAAQAARDTFGGALDAVRNTLGDLMTGKDGSLEEARIAVEEFNKTLESPEAKAAFSSVVASVAQGAGVIVKSLNAIPWQYMGEAATTLAAIMAGRFAGSMLTSAKNTVMATIEAAKAKAALDALSVSAGTATTRLTAMNVAASAGRGAMALLGGPAGIAMIAAGALLYFGTRATAADKETEKLAGRVAELAGNYKELAAQQVPAAITDLKDEIVRLGGELSKANAKTETLTGNLKNYPGSEKVSEWTRELEKSTAAAFGHQQEIDAAREKIDHLQRTMDGVTAKPMADGIKSEFAGIGDEIRLATALIGDFTAAQRFAIEASFGKHGNDVEQQKYLAGLYVVQDARRAGYEQQKRAEAAAKQAASRRASESKAAEKRAEAAAQAAIKKAQEEAKAIQDSVDALVLQEKQLGWTAEAIQLYDLGVKGATLDQIMLAAAVTESTRAFNEQAKVNLEAKGVIESLMTEEEAIIASYERRRELILASTTATEEEKREALLRLQKQTDDELIEAGDDYWAKYLAAAEKSLTNFDEMAGNVLESFTGKFGAAFEAMIFDSQSLGDSVRGMAEGMARSVVNALGQMAAQWIAYQVVQKLVGKTTQASAATTMSANAYATSMQAGLAAFASTAAIPIVGPAMAPAAMAAAIAATAPMAAAVTATSLAGMAHDGIDSIPQTGTWLLEKGERVTTASTSAKLDATLARIEQGGGKGGDGVTVNVHNAPEGTRVERRQVSDAEFVVDVMISDAAGDGRFTRFNQRTFGLKRQGS